ncbi:uncharacterized protein [Populus alba]|uniref:uncharacterized protein isoform X4 n=1 Tax=Populus alba TaxID=43335 RepID=UPI003CC6FA56
MSSDSAKENASVVDSSVTEWKHDMGNSDDPESPSYKGNEDGYPNMAEKAGHDRVGNSSINKKGKLCNTRYFIIKSLNHHNIQLSIENGIWATQVRNEPILEEAFHELPEDIGEALCELIDGERDTDGMVKRDDLPMKRPCIDPSSYTGDGEYTVPPLQMPWGRTPTPYPSFLYQQHDEASRFHLAHQGPTAAGFTDNALSSGASKVARMKQSRNSTNLRIHCEMPSRTDIWGLSAESPLTSTLTDDDFLEMTYEEYLEAHSRSIKQLNPPAAGPSQTTQEPSRSRKHDDNLNSSFVTDLGRPRKRSHSRNSSEK